MSAADRDRILVGRFGAPHGVRGEIRLKSFTADPLAIAGYGELAAKDDKRRFRLTASRHIKDDMLVVRVAGIGDRTAAEALNNLELFVDRSQLPAPEEDEFYLADLIGMDARLADGTPYGRIVNVANFGAGDILEILTPATGQVMIPFTRAAVPEVNLSARHVVVAPPTEIDGEDRGPPEKQTP